VAALALVVAVLACATSQPWTPARRMVAAKCAACHPVPRSQSVSADKWDEVFPAHAKRVELTPEHRQLIESHVVAR